MGLFSGIIHGIEHVADDMGSLVDTAFHELETIGISLAGDVGWLIKFLLEAGEDPVAVISQLCSKIERLGGEVGSTLEELAGGIMNHGLTGFAQIKVKQAIAPLGDALNQSTSRAQAVANVHLTTLQTMQTRLTALTVGDTSSGVAWQGPGADSMRASFTSISGGINGLTVPLEGDGAQAQLNRICEQALVDIIVVGAIIVVLEIIVTAIVATVGVVTGPGDVVILGGGGALIGATLEVLALLIGADLLAWLLGTLVIYTIGAVQGISVHHMSKGGNKNVGDTGIENEARKLIEAGKAASMCDALAILMDAAKRARDTSRQGKIKATQKKFGCRHRGGH
jgi:hypothetical protein